MACVSVLDAARALVHATGVDGEAQALAAIVAAIGTVGDVPTADAPVYQWVHDRLANAIADGRLSPGTRLPPTRSLAPALGIHRNTLVRAFSLLEAGGWIEATPGRGSFVRGPSRPAGGLPRDLGDLLSRAATSDALSRLRRAAPPRPARAAAAPIDLARMQPSPDLLPHADFADCMGAVLRRLGPAALGYAPSQGVSALRERIAADLARVGIAAAADDIIVTSGSQQGLDLVARTLVDPGDAFFTEARTYSGALTILAATGADVIGIDADAQGPDLAQLEARTAALQPGQRLKGLYLVPNARNPTGTSISPARRIALLAWARERVVPVIEDDYGADLVLDPGAEMAPLRALDPNVVHVGTFSKKLIPALRVGYVVVPPVLREPLLGLKHTMDLGTSPLLQHALAEYLGRGLLADHLARVQAAYRRRRDALVSALDRRLPDGVSFVVPRQGLALWLSLPRGADAVRIQEDAAAAGLLVSPGSVYATRQARDAGLRLTFGGEPERRLEEGARILIRVLERHLQRRGAEASRSALIGI